MKTVLNFIFICKQKILIFISVLQHAHLFTNKNLNHNYNVQSCMESEMNHTAMNHSAMNHTAMNHTVMNHTAINHTAMNHTAMNHTTMNHTAMNHTALRLTLSLPAYHCRQWNS